LAVTTNCAFETWGDVANRREAAIAARGCGAPQLGKPVV
jgi:hypothetical protein